MPAISLLTDFGARDWFVGTLKGVILNRAPRVQLVDVTHDVPPGDIKSAAFALLQACRHFPRGTVHLAVVDPGVGSDRAALAAKSRDYLFVGPDNGILSWALGREQSVRVRRLENRRLFQPDVSATFHGRDVFAPVAAYLARGDRFAEVGPQTTDWVRLPWPEFRREETALSGEVVYVDRFGNLITNLPKVPPTDAAPASQVRLPSGATVPLRACYSAVAPGQSVALWGSAGLLEIAINGGSAAATLRLDVGARVVLEPREDRAIPSSAAVNRS